MVELQKIFNVLPFWLEVAWLVWSIGLCLLIGLELLLSLIRRIEASGDDPRSEADGYLYEQATQWAVAYFREWSTVVSRFRWEPYVYWRPEPFRGQYITINEKGLRKTWQAPVDHTRLKAPDTTIWLFGGSTMWGEGVRDDFTIASLLARSFYEVGIHAHVVNFAQIGYISTQEVITLQRELEAGATPPSFVIFYDGYNDILSAVENEVAGVPYKEWHRRAEYGLSKRKRLLLMTLLRNLHSTQLFTPRIEGRERMTGQSLSEAQLATDIMHIYNTNVKIVEALGESFHFHPLFFWQPTIFQKRFLTTYEQEEAGCIEHSKRYFLKVYRAMKSNPSPSAEGNFLNLDDLFAEEKRPYYIDWAHLTEGGNEKVARRLFAVLFPLVQEQRQMQAC